eukprot:SAG11_NODE_1656_length_4502_cov_2.265955_3_plen_156_part_00
MRTIHPLSRRAAEGVVDHRRAEVLRKVHGARVVDVVPAERQDGLPVAHDAFRDVVPHPPGLVADRLPEAAVGGRVLRGEVGAGEEGRAGFPQPAELVVDLPVRGCATPSEKLLLVTSMPKNLLAATACVLMPKHWTRLCRVLLMIILLVILETVR